MFLARQGLVKIERPDWLVLMRLDRTDPDSYFKKSEFDEWFDKHVEPINKMLEEGVEVYNDETLSDTIWAYDMRPEFVKDQTRKALLINIQPIVKETAEDVLRDILNADWDDLGSDLHDRAKAVS